MSKPLSILSPEQLDRLKFIKGTHLLVRGIRKIQTVHRLDSDYFTKLETFLSGKAPLSVLQEGMKVFIIPDGSISGADMVAVCKRLNLKVTTDINKAAAIIGNTNLRTKDVSYRSEVPVVKMTIVDYMYFVYCAEHQHGHVLKYLQGDIKLSLTEIPEIKGNDTVLFSRKTIDEHYPSGINNYDADGAFLVSDSIMEIVYHALDRKLPVVNDSELFGSLEKLVITEESYDVLKSMYQSYDANDWNTANEILFNCDYVKSKFYIWKLYDNFSRAILTAKRTKKYDNFDKECGDFLGIDVDTFIEIAAKENILPESFYNEYMEEEIRTACKKVSAHNKYLAYEVKPKFTYQEFLNHHQNVGREETIH